MSQGTVNYANSKLDLTVRIYDEFYSYNANVPADQYDIVLSYFKKEMKNDQVAGNFTVSLFQVSESTGIPALTLLEQFRGIAGLNVSLNMAYYLNQIRNKATLLGVNNSVTPNFYAARNVIQ